ncbi:hypothetical protein [Clostridium saccharobutylicum]|uniref:Uncharacterized protein n=1 Tax=Clostridium saccharobutylicum TaxID=169679 RepID=A0A1S8N578_CLOSA|nr:hypothetical protein [Clostridium saccharobutylicum]OOM11676.1 hypothetical protein CLOSAC_21030 [Clostridium saccharobutylicum]
MKSDYVRIFLYFLEPAIIGVVIIMGITIVIRVFKNFINRNRQIDKTTDDSLRKLEKNKIITALIIVINIIFGLLFPFGLMVAMISPMTFDAPGSNKNFYNWIFFYATFSFPIVILVAIITSLIFLFILKSYKMAIIFSLLPMLNIIIVIFTVLLNSKL